jgi:hypothetical protein
MTPAVSLGPRKMFGLTRLKWPPVGAVFVLDPEGFLSRDALHAHRS